MIGKRSYMYEFSYHLNGDGRGLMKSAVEVKIIQFALAPWET